MANDIGEIDETTANSASAFTNDGLVKNLDLLLSHVVDDAHISANEFVNFDEEVPVFNECDNNEDNTSIIVDIRHDQDDKDDEVIQDQPPSLVEALEMIRKLHLLASTRQPELHQLVADLESKLTDVYIDSKSNKQSSILDFFQKA